MGAYRVAPDEPNDQVLGRYLWNVALAEALYPTLAFLEVALRNAFHGGIAMITGPGWYDNASVVVNQRARDEIAETKRRIAELGRPADGPHIIAGLDLGFWTGLCNREYEQGPFTPDGQIPLWPVLMKHIGPLLPHALRTRSGLSEYLGRVRIIRNRAFHHEPLWPGHPDRRGQRVPLSVDHASMQELVTALNPSCAALMRVVDRFPQVFDDGPGQWSKAVKELCDREGIEP